MFVWRCSCTPMLLHHPGYTFHKFYHLSSFSHSNPDHPQRPRMPIAVELPRIPNILHIRIPITEVVPPVRLPLQESVRATIKRGCRKPSYAHSDHTFACMCFTSSVCLCFSRYSLFSFSLSAVVVRLSCVASLWSSGFSSPLRRCFDSGVSTMWAESGSLVVKV